MFRLISYIQNRLDVRRKLNSLVDPTFLDRWWEAENGGR